MNRPDWPTAALLALCAVLLAAAGVVGTLAILFDAWLAIPHEAIAAALGMTALAGQLGITSSIAKLARVRGVS